MVLWGPLLCEPQLFSIGNFYLPPFWWGRVLEILPCKMNTLKSFSMWILWGPLQRSLRAYWLIGTSKAVIEYLVFVTVVFCSLLDVKAEASNNKLYRCVLWTNGYWFLLFKPRLRILLGGFPWWFLTTGLKANHKDGYVCIVTVWVSSRLLEFVRQSIVDWYVWTESVDDSICKTSI